jgi:hypothetical protein
VYSGAVLLVKKEIPVHYLIGRALLSGGAKVMHTQKLIGHMPTVARALFWAGLVAVFTTPCTADSWNTAAPMPTARRFLAAATGRDGSTIYAIGGFNNSGNLNTVEVYMRVPTPGALPHQCPPGAKGWPQL